MDFKIFFSKACPLHIEVYPIRARYIFFINAFPYVLKINMDRCEAPTGIAFTTLPLKYNVSQKIDFMALFRLHTKVEREFNFLCIEEKNWGKYFSFFSPDF